MPGVSGLTDDLPKVMFLTHREQNCGIHQYGEDTADALCKSRNITLIPKECGSAYMYHYLMFTVNPDVVIYNYYPATMPWLHDRHTRRYPAAVHLGIMHEVTQDDADGAGTEMFDYHLCPDPTLVTDNPAVRVIPRLVPQYTNATPDPGIPTIGSFGFGFPDKGFQKIVQMVCDEYGVAEIQFNMPRSEVVDIWGEMRKETVSRCHEIARKHIGIDLKISDEFLTKQGVLDFLAGNTVNMFLYDVHKGRGISSVIDYALAVKRPLAINRCGMFRHVHAAAPSMCVEDATLHQIIRNGTGMQDKYREAWSEQNFIRKYENIISEVLA